jgi:hypothetical protein
MRDVPSDEQALMLSPEGLTSAVLGVRHTFNRLKQVFGKVFAGTSPCNTDGDDTEDDLDDTDADFEQEVPAGPVEVAA